MNKRGLLGTVVAVGVLLVVGFFWFVGEMNGAECSDCVKVQVGCCPCNMGGVEKCVPKSEEAEYLDRLENCSEQTICAAVFNCEIESCACDSEGCFENE